MNTLGSITSGCCRESELIAPDSLEAQVFSNLAASVCYYAATRTGKTSPIELVTATHGCFTFSSSVENDALSIDASQTQ